MTGSPSENCVGRMPLREYGTHTCMDNSVLGNNTVLGGVGFNDLELDGSPTSSYEESVTLANRAVG